MTFSEITSTTLNVSWGEPAAANGVLQGYRVVYEPLAPVQGKPRGAWHPPSTREEAGERAERGSRSDSRPPGAPDPGLHRLPLLRPQGSSHPGTASRNHVGSVAGGGAGPRRCAQVLLRVTLRSDVNSSRVFWEVHTVGLQHVPRPDTEAEPPDPEHTLRAEWAFLSAPLRAQDHGAGEGREPWS